MREMPAKTCTEVHEATSVDPLLPNTGTHETTGLSVQCRIHRAHGCPDEDEHVCAWERGDAGRIGWDREWRIRCETRGKREQALL